MVYFSGYRTANIKQAIALEADREIRQRPSWRMDERTSRQEFREWLQLLLSNPSDAITLLRINRRQSKVTMLFNHSDDWSHKW